MTISAHAPVPAGSRLIDADTVDLARFVPVPLAERIAALQDAYPRPLTVAELAARLRVAPADIEAARPTGCPTWCSEDHRGQITEQDGFSIGLVHELKLAELTALDPGRFHPHPATASVYIESTTEVGEPVDPPRIVLTVAEGAEGQYHGSLDTGGWTGTPEQAVALAYALIEAAAVLRGDAR